MRSPWPNLSKDRGVLSLGTWSATPELRQAADCNKIKTPATVKNKSERLGCKATPYAHSCCRMTSHLIWSRRLTQHCVGHLPIHRCGKATAASNRLYMPACRFPSLAAKQLIRECCKVDYMIMRAASSPPQDPLYFHPPRDTVS